MPFYQSDVDIDGHSDTYDQYETNDKPRSGFGRLCVITTTGVSLIVLGVLISLGLFVHRELSLAVPPPPPMPPPQVRDLRPRYPPAPPGDKAQLRATSFCAVLYAGILVSLAHDGVCDDQDGLPGCADGTDYPDCPIRFVLPAPPPPPLYPSPHLPPPPSPPPQLPNLTDAGDITHLMNLTGAILNATYNAAQAEEVAAQTVKTNQGFEHLIRFYA